MRSIPRKLRRHSSSYITFSETDVELRQSAKSHGWSLNGLSVIDLTQMNSELGIEKQYTVLHPADVELAETSTDLLKRIKALKPRRLVLYSLSELRMVARDPLRYRRQILALKQALSELGCTVLFLDDQTSETGADLLLQSIAHGVVQHTSEETSQGALHRRIKVTKMRGVPFIEGAHDFRIATGAIRVFPRLAQAGEAFLDRFNTGPPLTSGIKELDELMGGPIPWGFGVMIVGPPGICKARKEHFQQQYQWVSVFPDFPSPHACLRRRPCIAKAMVFQLGSWDLSGLLLPNQSRDAAPNHGGNPWHTMTCDNF